MKGRFVRDMDAGVRFLFPILADSGIPDRIFTMINRRETLHGARCIVDAARQAGQRPLKAALRENQPRGGHGYVD